MPLARREILTKRKDDVMASPHPAESRAVGEGGGEEGGEEGLTYMQLCNFEGGRGRCGRGRGVDGGMIPSSRVGRRGGRGMGRGRLGVGK